MTFGQLVRQGREDCGLSLMQLSQLIGMKGSLVSLLERDRVRPRSELLIGEIAMLLDMDPDILLSAARWVPKDMAEKITESPEMIKKIRSVLGLDVCQTKGDNRRKK